MRKFRIQYDEAKNIANQQKHKGIRLADAEAMFNDDAARERAESAGTGYQTVINNLLRQALVSQEAHNLAPAPKKRTKTLQVINNGISLSDVEALEQQLIAVAGELNRVLGTSKTKATL